jgi:hypothetical protein
MIWRAPFVVVAVLTLLRAASGTAEAEAVCGGQDYTLIVPDGRIFSSTIPPSTTFRFLIATNVASGGRNRSYSVEVRGVDSIQANIGISYQIPNLGSCTLINSGTATDTKNYEPLLWPDSSNGGGFRFSFSGTVSQVAVLLFSGNNANQAIRYSISASETTMFSPAWSTNGTYDTFYSFYNTTDETINGTLTLYNAAGTAVTTDPVTIPPLTTALLEQSWPRRPSRTTRPARPTSRP